MNDSRPYPDIKQSFILVLICLGIAVGYSAVNRIADAFLKEYHIYVSTVIKDWVLYVLMTLTGITVALRKKRKAPGGSGISLGFRRISFYTLILLVLATLCLEVVLDPLLQLVPMSKEMETLLVEVMSGPFILTFLTVVVSPAILEEILFRGIMLNGLLKNHSPAKGIFVSAFLFGIIHLNLLQFTAAFASGIFIGWVYWKTQSLFACMFIHAITNFTAIAFYLVTADIKYSLLADMGIAGYSVLYTVSIVMLLLCLFLLNNMFQKMYEKRA